MKLLKIVASGLPLFKEKCEIDFFALQRVTNDNAEKMSALFTVNNQTFYQNNVLSFIGINASGKTSILKLISFVCGMLSNDSINNISYNEVLDGLDNKGKVVFDIFFYTENNCINLLHTVIGRNGSRFVIIDEYLKSKPISKVTSKSSMFDFNEYKAILTRNND